MDGNIKNVSLKCTKTLVNVPGSVAAMMICKSKRFVHKNLKVVSGRLLNISRFGLVHRGPVIWNASSYNILIFCL